jgi:hypothetical protein
MKRIFALLLVSGIVYLTSCKDSANPNLLVTPAQDSISKGSYFKINYSSSPGVSDSFNISDLILNNQVVISMTANTNLVLPDSFYSAKILITDHRSQKMSLSLYVFDSTTYRDTLYYRIDNSSTFTDYSKGENKNYSVATGSYVKISHDGADCVTGTFMLNLYYNHLVSPATGSFKIFH